MSLLNVPTSLITSVGLAIEASPDMYCYAATPNPGNPNQQWQLVYYASKNAVAILISMNNMLYALSSLPGENYPSLRPFLSDDSYLWRVPPMLGNQGIPTVRDNNYCLTWEGGSGWQPGTKLQYYTWKNLPNQHWIVTP